MFVGHLGGVQGGSVCTREASGAGGRDERLAGGAGVWPVTQIKEKFEAHLAHETLFKANYARYESRSAFTSS
jgi:hypothetical protein